MCSSRQAVDKVPGEVVQGGGAPSTPDSKQGRLQHLLRPYCGDPLHDETDHSLSRIIDQMKVVHHEVILGEVVIVLPHINWQRQPVLVTAVLSQHFLQEETSPIYEAIEGGVALQPELHRYRRCCGMGRQACISASLPARRDPERKEPQMPGPASSWKEPAHHTERHHQLRGEEILPLLQGNGGDLIAAAVLPSGTQSLDCIHRKQQTW